jgi:hypothetical protein
MNPLEGKHTPIHTKIDDVAYLLESEEASLPSNFQLSGYNPLPLMGVIER